MSVGRHATGLGAIGGLAGEGAAALVALVTAAWLYRRRRAGGSRC
jgi:hypothetical protein